MVETYGANFEASDVLRMFPTFVWKTQVAPSVRQGIEDDVLAKLDEMRRDAGEPAPGHGWQSEKNLHHLDEFRGLVVYIRDAAQRSQFPYTFFSWRALSPRIRSEDTPS